MRALVSFFLAMVLVSASSADVSVQVYRADERTLLELADPNIPDLYRDIMVGTRLTLFVVSDTPESTWSGGLWVSWDDWERGTLTGRGFNDQTFSYDGSILPAAGRIVHVIDSFTESGVDFALDARGAIPGEWFVLDYHAEVPGTCKVRLHASDTKISVDPYEDGEPPPAGQVWIQGLSFNHVPSQDYSGDSRVNFVDFALWAAQWKRNGGFDPNETTPGDPNGPSANDLSNWQAVDGRDLALFCTYWLEQTDVDTPAVDPNEPQAAP